MTAATPLWAPLVIAVGGKQYEVSQATADRAIAELAEEGRVTTVRGWGTFAAQHPLG